MNFLKYAYDEYLENMGALKKVTEIKEEVQAAEETMLPSFILTYEKDERAGVRKLVEQAGKRLKALEDERERIEGLKVYGRKYENKRRF